MKKEWYFDRFCGQQFAALLENGRLAEFSTEKEGDGCLVGNVYKGKVTNVLSGMNAAFISCGQEKNCYLSMEETYTDYTKYDGTPIRTQKKPLALKVGDELIVQVTKPPRGNKGAKVTTHISFVGKCLIYLPQTDFLGISRKITDEKERERLLRFADKLRSDKTSEGFIVRTQAPFASTKHLKAEAEYLKKMYAQMLRTAKNAPVSTLLYQDEELSVRALRDCFGEEITAIHVADETLYKRLQAIVKLRGDIPEKKLVKYTGTRSLFRAYGITPLIAEATRPIVPLSNGGYLVIENTEAMTVVDVNTGSYIGETSLEETVFAVNLEAAKEIARQVRLRNVGGIVTVDFIDMAEEAHRLAVTKTLQDALALDKAKCNVLPMNELCITQFTRKRVGTDVQSSLVKPCPLCEGKGYAIEDMFVVALIRAELLDCFADGYTSAIVELNINIMQKILSEGLFSEALKTNWKDKRVYFVPHKTYKETHFTVHGDNAPVLRLPNNAQILY